MELRQRDLAFQAEAKRALIFEQSLFLYLDFGRPMNRKARRHLKYALPQPGMLSHVGAQFYLKSRYNIEVFFAGR